MSTEEQYAIITKNIFIEERVHNWIKETMEARLQEEEKQYTKRLDKLKQEKLRLEADLMGLGELPMYHKKNQSKQAQGKQFPPFPKKQEQDKKNKSESIVQKLNNELAKACGTDI